MNNTYDNKFLKDFLPFQKKISYYGIFNSLSQALLKITSPGVPDFYQGTEIWDFSLVDPDNRRPVDYSMRMRMLEGLKKRESEILLSELAENLTINKDDGRIKLYLIYKALNYRSKNREIFEKGEYLTIEVMGEKANNVCAFARRIGNSIVQVIAPRLFTGLIQQQENLPFGKEIWQDSFIVLPFDVPGARYHNIFTGETLTAVMYKGATVLYLSEIISVFPVALLERID
jgi:(1->4)-alpha-D-glucan 1-alpha-D-glucosylmutase